MKKRFFTTVVVSLVSLFVLAAFVAAYTSFTPDRTFTDGSGDVGVPNQCKPGGDPGGTGLTGWDLVEVATAYDRTNDELHVGISAHDAIVGDVDGDGDPGGTSDCLASLGGQDYPDFGSAESVDFIIDADADGTFETIVGMPSGQDISGLGVYEYTGSNPPYSAPGQNYGSAIAGANAILANNPSAADPDYEIVIEDFSSLLGKTTADTLEFCAVARAGSLATDAGYGEDIAPNSSCFSITYAPPASLGDFVWLDLDEDGVQDAGEPGLEGVTVTLKDASGNQVGSPTTTDANGAYSFTDLEPGDYTVVFTLPGSDWSFSPQDQGSDEALDSDADPNTGEAGVTLSSGENDITIDAGMSIPSSYAITKENTTAAPEIAPGDPVSFTITIENTGKTWLTEVPLRDEYDANYLTYVDANPASDDNNDDGAIDWSDLTVSFGQDLAPGDSISIVVNFTAKAATDETVNTATAHDVQADPDGPNGPNGPIVPLPDQSDDAPADILNPVGEDMAGFSARAAGNAVRLHWQTASELDILGFNVLRSAGDGHWEQINEFPIFAHHPGADMDGLYSFQDRGVPGESVIYALEIIHLDGGVERYGRASVYLLARIF